MARAETAIPLPRIVSNEEYGNFILERETSTPRLATIRQEMLAGGKEWLWDAINLAINLEFDAQWDTESREPVGTARQEIVQAAVRGLTDYPPRPASPPPDSQSFAELISVLGRAPVNDPDSNSRGDGVLVEYDLVTDSVQSISWSRSYTGEVHAALIKVMEEHEFLGWQHARWLVYDTVSKIR